MTQWSRFYKAGDEFAYGGWRAFFRTTRPLITRLLYGEV